MERGVGLVGLAILIGIAFSASTNRSAIRWRTIAIAFATQWSIALIALHTSIGVRLFQIATNAAVGFLSAANSGIDFVFGTWPSSVMGPEGEVVSLPFVFATRVLPILIFMSSVFQILYHWGILQRLVGALARALRSILPLSGAESLAVIGNIFVGMTEAPLMVRPYVQGMTRSELFCVMTAGLATIAGTVLIAYMSLVGPEYASHLIAASFMAAPAAVAFSKILIPETERPATLETTAQIEITRSSNSIDAAASGALDGLRLALNIGALLIAFVALIYLLDAGLAAVFGLFGGEKMSSGHLFGLLLSPLALLLGVPAAESVAVGELLGFKTVVNEFLAYQMLSSQLESLSPKSLVIASYALCGFANFGSLAILLGGLGGIAPERRPDIARDGLRAILAGSLATFSSGAIAGILLTG